MRPLRIGTRGSGLALAQSRWVASQILRTTGREAEIVVVKTSGDRFQAQALASFGGVGAFTMEIDAAQRAGQFEISVHSLKDLPTQGRDGLRLAAVPPREAVEDCLVTRGRRKFAELPPGATVATGSARRAAQLLQLAPHLRLAPLRGNVETRIRKVRDGEADATLLARAGLVRLGLVHEIDEVLDVRRMVPAAGQGALAIVVRDGDDDALDAVRALDDAATRSEIDAEREVLGALGGGCHLPLGAVARVEGAEIELVARVVSADGRESVEERATGPVAAARRIGALVGAALIRRGAPALLPAVAR